MGHRLKNYFRDTAPNFQFLTYLSTLALAHSQSCHLVHVGPLGRCGSPAGSGGLRGAGSNTPGGAAPPEPLAADPGSWVAAGGAVVAAPTPGHGGTPTENATSIKHEISSIKNQVSNSN